MRAYEKMIAGIGFYYEGKYDAIPTFDELQQMVRELAHEHWRQSGCPEGDGMLFWLEAEKELLGGLADGGYFVYGCDRLDRCNAGFYRIWDVFHVSPCGVRRHRI